MRFMDPEHFKKELAQLLMRAPAAADESGDIVSRLEKAAAAGDVVAQIALDSLLSSPMYAGRKKKIPLRPG